MSNVSNGIRQDVVMRYKDMYKRKLITETQLEKLVSKGVLSQEEYELVIAEENN